MHSSGWQSTRAKTHPQILLRRQKKRDQTVETDRMGDPTPGQCRFCRGDGTRARCLPTAVPSSVSGHLHGRDSSAVDPRNAGPDTAPPRAVRALRLRIPALRRLQRLHGHGAFGRQADDQGDRAQDEGRLGTLSRRHCRALFARQKDHPGDGQPQHTAQVRSTRPIPRRRPKRCGTGSSSSTPPSTGAG